ncbi:hypothetical protein EXIGLDRAFT_701985 [Exidia glandulosa HHB12029]|uniref:Uncharacterized protein n=1 Tax=Exidia glandulosa HHB12029 TaxID=1314781 RepID=A0A165CT85_EXIGL|nr:hypothetical protein EXIGLDRAFT_701985 [Exidia glandulosa HHB12029]
MTKSSSGPTLDAFKSAQACRAPNPTCNSSQREHQFTRQQTPSQPHQTCRQREQIPHCSANLDLPRRPKELRLACRRLRDRPSPLFIGSKSRNSCQDPKVFLACIRRTRTGRPRARLPQSHFGLQIALYAPSAPEPRVPSTVDRNQRPPNFPTIAASSGMGPLETTMDAYCDNDASTGPPIALQVRFTSRVWTSRPADLHPSVGLHSRLRLRERDASDGTNAKKNVFISVTSVDRARRSGARARTSAVSTSCFAHCRRPLRSAPRWTPKRVDGTQQREESYSVERVCVSSSTRGSFESESIDDGRTQLGTSLTAYRVAMVIQRERMMRDDEFNVYIPCGRRR